VAIPFTDRALWERVIRHARCTGSSLDPDQWLLQPSATRSHCPYKGTASYWSADTGRAVYTDIVWIYRTPLQESQKIAGLACFYNLKTDLYLDGVLQERPQTKFS
jgi:Domain of unknown function (DUF427)